MADPKYLKLKIESPVEGAEGDLIEQTEEAFDRSSRARARTIKMLEKLLKSAMKLPKFSKDLRLAVVWFR